jgi:hypothetical protein
MVRGLLLGGSIAHLRLLSTFYLMLQCSVMDAGRCSVCGEESFGTGSDHIRCCSCMTLRITLCSHVVPHRVTAAISAE